MKLSLAALMIFTPDLAHAKAFYQGILGLSVKAETDRHVTFLVGSVELQAFKCESPGHIANYAKEPRSVFVFRVDDIDTAMAELQARGVVFLHPAPAHSDGVRYAAFADPFGNVHELAQTDGSS